jgi:hypothetical protein
VHDDPAALFQAAIVAVLMGETDRHANYPSPETSQDEPQLAPD